ncbi:MAG: ComF family protein [Candidatus Nanopelagicaceae bacterium]
MLAPLKELLFPVHCFGCRAIGIEVCSKCRKFWNPHFYVQTIEELKIYSAIRYSPVARSILLGAKENSYAIADELMIDALLNCLHRLPSQVLRKATLIPIPGSKRAIRKRGRDFIFDLTKEVSLRSGVPMVSGIYIERRLLDQSGLSAVDRKRNISGAFTFDKTVQKIDGEILLVDDLVTTGATLLEAKRALNKSGFSVNRAITACVAQTSNI